MRLLEITLRKPKNISGFARHISAHGVGVTPIPALTRDLVPIREIQLSYELSARLYLRFMAPVLLINKAKFCSSVGPNAP